MLLVLPYSTQLVVMTFFQSARGAFCGIQKFTAYHNANDLPSLSHAMYIQDDKKNTPMRLLITRFPDLALTVLSKCTNECPLHSNIDRIDYAIIFNFDLIEDGFIDLREPRYAVTTCCTKSVQLLGSPSRSKDDSQRLTSENQRDEDSTSRLGWRDCSNDPLWMILELNRDEVLQHPLIKAFLELRQSFFFTVNVTRILFAFAFSMIISIIMLTEDVPVDDQTEYNQTKSENSTCSEGKAHHWKEDSNYYFRALIILSGIGICISVIQIATHSSEYFGCLIFRMSLDIITYILAVLFLLECSETRGTEVYIASWQWSLGTVCLLLSWFNLIVKMMNIASVGCFVLMMIEVLTTFLKTAIVLLPLIVGFGCTFYTMLKWTTNGPFQEWNEALLKTAVMTVGEIDLDKLRTYSKESQKKLWGWDLYLVTIYFLLFVTIMPIIVMNLLLGLAVGDIERIRKLAEAQGLRDTAAGTLAIYQLPICLQRRLHSTLSNCNVLGKRIQVLLHIKIHPCRRHVHSFICPSIRDPFMGVFDLFFIRC